MATPEWANSCRIEIEKSLSTGLSEERDVPTVLASAMRHSVLAGGKRIRPLLLIAGYEAVAGDSYTAHDLTLSRSTLIRVGCAIELIHTYSLIHDDLPIMDNDDFRRGIPTCHRLFGEDIAILAGDGLHALAFSWLGEAATDPALGANAGLLALSTVARAVGPGGLVGGQALDLEGDVDDSGVAWLERTHRMKTGALLTASLEVGAILGGAGDDERSVVREVGVQTGLLFQIIDDILDVVGNREQLGKTPGKDLALGRTTYVTVLGLERAHGHADRLFGDVLASLDKLKRPACHLEGLVRMIHDRAGS